MVKTRKRFKNCKNYRGNFPAIHSSNLNSGKVLIPSSPPCLNTS